MSLPDAILLDFHGRMQRIRSFEEALAELFGKGVLGGTSHFCIGQEACAVGVIGALRETDWLVSNHRGHGHLLARGLELPRVAGELLGRLSGYCRGRGGSQHLCAMERCFLGTNGITGGGIPIGAGAAFALQYRGSQDITAVFFGDGASNQGTFHETLNMAALWHLPLLLVCENNLYGMSNPVDKACAGGRVAPRAAAYGIKSAVADGMQVEAIYAATERAAAHVRAGNGPFLLELMTYRHCGHSKNDARVYRDRSEEAAMQERDCLKLCRERLLDSGVAEAAIVAVEVAARSAVAAAIQEALDTPAGGVADALGGVYAD